MWSMTQSSTDTSFLIPVRPLATSPTTLCTPTSTLCSSHPTHGVTHNSSHPLPPTPSTPRQSFFDINSNSSLLSPHSRHRVTNAIRNWWAKLTVKHYSSSIRQYIHFCDIESIPEHLRFPADKFIVCAFSASSAGVYTCSTPIVSPQGLAHCTQLGLEQELSLMLCSWRSTQSYPLGVQTPTSTSCYDLLLPPRWSSS